METIERRPSCLDVHLGYWLRRVSNQVSAAFARALQTRQTSVAEWVLLSRLHDGRETTPTDLAASLTLTRGAISKIIDKLEAKNWLKRVTSQDDNRVQVLSLTSHGRRVLPQLAQIADTNDHHFFDCLDAHEQATLRRLLQKLADHHRIHDVPVA
jgi:DNA-binding MarR family transcriptional regulator